ncbi:MAG: 33-cGAMP-specific phosphodieSPTERase 1 [Firmicutes bacterium]|nr:33-cGAMP-specific phosphodieSPTERase 1 [Bacillota bacterium]
MTFMVYLTSLLQALSMALELSTGGLSRHHWRTALIGDRLAEHLALPFEQRRTLLHSSLLHDIGAASNWNEKNSLQTNIALTDYYLHAQRGYDLLKNSSKLHDLAIPIRHHHDFWDGSTPSGLSSYKIPLISRIINLADAFEVLLKDNIYILDQCPQVLSTLTKLSGIKFDPELVEALHEIARQEGFWLDLTNSYYYEFFFESIKNYGKTRLSIDDVLDIADIFSTIIDRTSQFTATHSRSVSTVSALLAETNNYSTSEVNLIRIAGLLHDLGKLAVPNAILEKPGKLTAYEYSLIKQHPYYTHRILNQIEGFDIIAEWAAYHHETPDGQGYPFRLNHNNLRLGSRIVAVADVFVALTEHRPYRQGLSFRQVQKIMGDMVNNNKLDGELVNQLWLNKNLLTEISYNKSSLA